MLHVINDTHLGVSRVAGATAASAEALYEWQFSQFQSLLAKNSGDLVVNGDLFDKFDVENRVLLRTFNTFADWLFDDRGNRLFLVAGNHDLSKDSSKLSSFEMLCGLLLRQFGVLRVQVANGKGRYLDWGPTCPVWVIPHMANQDLFDAELAKVPSDAKSVLLHCNYDNGFAAQSDHSLNLTRSQAEALPGTLVLGHEHQQRFALDDRIVVVGNQIPTSVADCLGPEMKYVANLDLATGRTTLEPWLDVTVVFERKDWRDLGEDSNAKFIRVEGDASAQEAAQVVTKIAQFRARSRAFVVTNSVRVEGANIMHGVVESLQDARTYDVVEAILGMLDDAERAVIKRLMGAA